MQKATSTNGRRIAAAMFIGAASSALVAGTAHADDITGATFDQGPEPGGNVYMTGDHHNGSYTALIGLDAPGSTDPVLTYCIQKTVELDQSETYDEHAWSEVTAKTGIDGAHLESIKWILNNSYPQIDTTALAAAASITGSLSKDEAVEATQAAIWSFSDTTGNTSLDVAKEKQKDPTVVDLYNYLVQAAGTTKAPSSLSITAQTASPAPGSKVAFKVVTNVAGAPISVALADQGKSGAKLVDANGKPLAANATFQSGDLVYVQLPTTPSKGEVSVTASGTATGIDGRVFVSADGKPSQNLILAQPQTVPMSATAAITWAPAATVPTTPSSSPSTAPSSHPSTTPTAKATTPSATPSTTASTPTTGGLAHTGAGDTVPLAGGALALLAAGSGMVVYTRRTRKQGTHS